MSIKVYTNEVKADETSEFKPITSSSTTKSYSNDEKEVIENSVTSDDIIKNIDEASRRVNVGETGTIKVGISANTAGINRASESSDIVFWAGAEQEDRDTAPFRVDAAGNLTATSVTISGVAINTKGNFGGDGSDGALSIASGTTTINLANAAVVIKNYTSISITGTGQLAFSNPNTTGSIVILKSQGDVTLTSSTDPNIQASGLGAAGGASGGTGAGNNGTTAVPLTDPGTAHYGVGGTGSHGTGGAQYANNGLYTITAARYGAFGRFVGCGSGGGAGSGDGVNNGGAGGNGGGVLIIECAGDLNATGNIKAEGSAGSDASGGAAPGGGGSGGSCIVFYDSATATSGTISDAGGDGGSGGASAGSGGGAGGIGGVGAAGTNNTGGGGAGGGGAGSGGSGGAASTSASHYIQI